MSNPTDAEFWRGKRVLMTGHTGFKGSWLALWLTELGTEVHGLALAPDTDPALFDQLQMDIRIAHRLGDIREAALVAERVKEVCPDIVFHLAAQPLVRRSYCTPVETWHTNVLGTVHLLDALRGQKTRCAVVIATTDKVYENQEWVHAYRETDRLGGKDPYSSSKAGTELVTDSFRASFFPDDGPIRIATARAGNVIGGGDWAEDRIMPDMMRSLHAGQSIAVRNPGAVRPWQHVLEPLSGYMELARLLWERNDATLCGAFNFGPNPNDHRRVADLVETGLSVWPGSWHDASEGGAVHEAGRLSLTIDKAGWLLHWAPRWNFELAVLRTVEWYRAVLNGQDAYEVTAAQIRQYSTEGTA